MANDKKKTATRVYINRGGNIVFERGGAAVAIAPEAMEKIQAALPGLIERAKKVGSRVDPVIETGAEEAAA